MAMTMVEMTPAGTLARAERRQCLKVCYKCTSAFITTRQAALAAGAAASCVAMAAAAAPLCSTVWSAVRGCISLPNGTPKRHHHINHRGVLLVLPCNKSQQCHTQESSRSASTGAAAIETTLYTHWYMKMNTRIVQHVTGHELERRPPAIRTAQAQAE